MRKALLLVVPVAIVAGMAGVANAAPRPVRDNTRPEVIAVNPADNSINVAVNTTITIKFSEPVTNVKVDIMGKKGSPATTERYDASTMTLTVTPNKALNPGIRFTVAVWGAKDTAGNKMRQTAWQFVTAAVTVPTPTPTQTTPAPTVPPVVPTTPPVTPTTPPVTPTTPSGPTPGPTTPTTEPPTTFPTTPPAEPTTPPDPGTVDPPAGSAGIMGASYDDGPDPVNTPRILDWLKAHNLKATFCVLGSQVIKYPAIAKRIVDEGHVICNHSWDHPDFPEISAAAQRKQIVDTQEAIKTATGFRPILFRYPHGDSTAAGDTVIRELGLWGGVLWNWQYSPAGFDGDWVCSETPARIADYATGNIVDQAPILLHDGGDAAACNRPAGFYEDYLTRMETWTKKKGYKWGVLDIAFEPNPNAEGSWVRVIEIAPPEQL